MTPSDIFNFSIPIVNALGPAILVTAVVANARELITLLHQMVRGWK